VPPPRRAFRLERGPEVQVRCSSGNRRPKTGFLESHLRGEVGGGGSENAQGVVSSRTTGLKRRAGAPHKAASGNPRY
jgi:hypothetical protein